MSLLDKPTSGEVYLNNEKTSALSEAQKTALRLTSFGFVFQDYALLPELTAQENVALPMLMHGMSRSAAYEKASVSLRAHRA
jgi:putative ABC transport system ATP-binding protein